MAIPFPNAGFETGDNTGWTLGPNSAVVGGGGYSGTYCLSFTGTNGFTTTVQSTIYPTYEGLVISAGLMYRQGAAGVGGNPGAVIIRWFDATDTMVSESVGNYVVAGRGGAWHPSNVTASTPSNAVGFSVGVRVNRTGNPAKSDADAFTWNYNGPPSVVLTYPVNGQVYAATAEVPYRVSITNSGNVAQVEYVVTNTATTEETIVGPVTEAPYYTNHSGLPAGTYSVLARVTFTNGTVQDSNTHSFVMGIPTPPTTREYKASNAHTYLVAENFVGLAGSIPPTAQIVGMQTVVDYYVEALIRSKDLDVTDPEVAQYAAAFDMVPSATFEVALLENDESVYTSLGTKLTEQVDIQRSDYTVLEDGTSEGKRWTILRGADKQVTIGNEDNVNGMDTMPAADIVSKSVGIRFFPNLAPKPAYADSGDACFRVHIDKLRVQIYFDAGSVEYYFASPGYEHVIKGTLVSAEVLSGNVHSADGSGILQLLPELELMDGSQTWIGNDWTIHAAYPPTDNNQIGDVGDVEGEDAVGMAYNGLPTQAQVKDNRSRYVMITANFFGTTKLNSIYGANGVGRGFAYNPEFFYKVYTQPDAEKDKPRHVAYHHAHLALGYADGRVDISVVGEPYNFSGVDGASSWALGDRITGLLPLSGTILGAFGSKSVWGISGTTVDNFATQVISPNIGAIEYTIADMGSPVYANAYGIYTLQQTQQYGDYLGTPLSQDVSPWLRPRLVRKYTSEKEVAVAWPVRSKNQYRLAFSDGYVLSMTMNGQAVPTFSKQKYFYEPSGEWEPQEDMYLMPAIVPAAVSSELDDSGEERIHIAPYVDVVVPEAPETVCTSIQFTPYDDPETETVPGPENNMPSWFVPGDQFAVRFPGDEYVYYFSEMSDSRYQSSGPGLPFTDYDSILHGEIAMTVDDAPENFNWSCLHATSYPPA